MLFGCVVDLLARVSGEYPVLVVLDDLHWADRGSVQLLRHVVARDEPMRVGVLGTFRDSDITTDHPLADFLAALHRENRGVRIALRGLRRRRPARTCWRRIAGHEMDDHGVALRDALLAETAGNPFFVAEILRHLAETGAIYQQDDGRWVADADLRAVGLPVSVREVVGRRLAGLGPDTERVLGLGSVIGRDFDIALLAAVAQIDEDTRHRPLRRRGRRPRSCRPPTIPTATRSPTRSSSTPSTTASHRPGEPRAHKAVAEQLEALAGPDGGTGSVSSPTTGPRPSNPPTPPKPSTTPRSPATAPSTSSRPTTPSAGTRRRSSSSTGRPSPTAANASRLLIGLGDAQRQSGVAAHREHLLEAAELADAIDAVDLLVRAVLANSRGCGHHRPARPRADRHDPTGARQGRRRRRPCPPAQPPRGRAHL